MTDNTASIAQDIQRLAAAVSKPENVTGELPLASLRDGQLELPLATMREGQIVLTKLPE